MIQDGIEAGDNAGSLRRCQALASLCASVVKNKLLLQLRSHAVVFGVDAFVAPAF